MSQETMPQEELVNELTRLRTELEQMRAEQHHRAECLLAAGHELRNPLTTIIGFAELMVNNNLIDIDQQQQFLHYILKKGQLLSHVIDDLQYLARVEDNRPLVLRKEICDLRQTLSEICDQFALEHNNHQFSFRIDSQPLVTSFDRFRIEQVLHNLLSNAVKYSPEGGQIKVRAILGQNKVHISIQDEGLGMTRDEVERAFDTYFRSKSHAQKIGGLGLGLTICRSIINAHGGTIELKSRPAEGTLVHLTLPVVIEGLQPHQPPAITITPAHVLKTGTRH